MKKIQFLLCLVLSIATFTSCSDMLDENPEYSVNSKTVFESENTAMMALRGCYGYLTTYDVYGQAVQELFVGASGVTWTQTNGADQDRFNSFNANAQCVITGMVWRGYYKTINECNFFIENIENSPLGEEYKTYMKAHARFIRGLCYYNLAGAFGGVPLRINSTTAETMSQARATREEVYKQVEEDWKAAAEGLLPANAEEMKGENIGLASRYAAYAYLAKLYFMQGSQSNDSASPWWAKAKEAGDKVIAEGGYKLENNFSNLFQPKLSTSPEAIFQLNFTTTSTLVGNRGNWLFAPSKATTGISWARIRVAKEFYDQFRGTYPDDPRLDATFLSSWLNTANKEMTYAYPYISWKATENGEKVVKLDSIPYNKLKDPTNPQLSELSVKVDSAFTQATGDHQGWPMLKKAIDWNATAQNSYKNIFLYRYADFLLLMADVENELGNTAKAVDYINQVLQRARMSGSKGATYPQNIASSVSQTTLRDRIYYERIFELVGEPEMYMDIRRRGADYLKKIADLHNNHTITKTFVERAEAKQNRTNFRDRLLPSTGDDMKKNLLLPIPQAEMNSNEHVTTADQNFGY